jgi:hypothetical protein
MNIESRKFDNPRAHHRGWFRVFRFGHGIEIWFGKRWISVSR